MRFMLWIYLLAIGTSLGLASRAPAAEVTATDSIRKYHFKAKTAREKKDYDEALEFYREYLKYESNEKKARQAYYYIGDIHFGKKEFEAAKQALKQAVSLDSLYANPNIKLYQIYRSQSRPDSAAQCLERVVQALPDKLLYRRKLADLYRLQNRTRDAIRHYIRIIEMAGDDEELCDLLAVLHEDLGETARALEWRRRLLQVQGVAGDSSGRGQGEQMETLESILELQRKSGDVQGAFETLKQLVESDLSNRYSYYSQIAELAEKEGDKAMRIKGLEGMARSNSKDLETVAILVDLHLREKKQEAAQKWLERGLREDETNAHLQLLKGELLILKGGAEEEAIQAFERAKEDPVWEQTAQQRIWQLRPPETAEEKLKKKFFGGGDEE
jgi:tetratricopeptide (TPR) repeat protein